MKVNKIHVMITHIVTIITICVDANIVFGPYFLDHITLFLPRTSANYLFLKVLVLLFKNL
jgi:hypothetical protein